MLKIIQQVIGIGLTVWFIYMAYFETGPYTTLVLVLMAITFKLQEYLNTASAKNMLSMSDLLGKIVGRDV